MAKTWTFQYAPDVRKHGEESAPWYVGWYDPAGRRKSKNCGAGSEGKRIAEKERVRLAAQLITGTYEDRSKESWKDFRARYELLVLEGLSGDNRKETENALAHFERIVKPKKIATVCTGDVCLYVAHRRKEGGLAGTVSVATINKELRHLRAVFRKAVKLKCLAQAPEFDFIKEPKKIPPYCTPEHFAALYHACPAATRPAGKPYEPADWWRGVLVTGYMTGWRIGSILALRREDVDLEAGTAFSHHGDNKGKRDQMVCLHPLVIDHLKRVPGFDPVFFPWPHDERQLYDEFERVQRQAGVKPRGKDRYGFHDLRRAFATMNAGRLSADVLQALMQHQAYTTTQRYINLARQLKPAAHDLFTPDLGKPPRAAEGDQP